MFGDSKELGNLRTKVTDLSNKLSVSVAENNRLKEFYEETKTAEITRLNDLIKSLTKDNESMRDAKDAARKELTKEYSDRVSTIEGDYKAKLTLEMGSNAKKIEFIEASMNKEIDNRVNEAVAQIKLDNKELKMERKHETEMHNIYKEKFESGKVELGADEIKGMLLSANPNGQKIIETMSSM